MDDATLDNIESDLRAWCHCDPESAFRSCNWCRTATAVESLRQRVAELEKDRARLLSAVGDAQHALESMRIWGGMDWHWHQPNARRAHTILSDAMGAK